MPDSTWATSVLVKPPRTTVCMLSKRASAVIVRVVVVSCFTPSTVWSPTLTFEYSVAMLSITVPFGLIFGLTLILMPISFCS